MAAGLEKEVAESGHSWALPWPPWASSQHTEDLWLRQAGLPFPPPHLPGSMARNSAFRAFSELWVVGTPTALQQLPEGLAACSPGIMVPAWDFFSLPVQVEHLPPCCLFFLAKVQF